MWTIESLQQEPGIINGKSAAEPLLKHTNKAGSILALNDGQQRKVAFFPD